MALTAAATTLVTYLIVTSRFGLRLMTIREDEVAAEAMGIDTFRHKLYAFLISAVGAGIVGGLSARDQGYIEPVSVFPLITTVTMIVMALFGGKGTVWGPVLGAVVLFVVPGGGVGALPLRAPAPVRRHHRGGRAPDAAGGAGLLQVRYRLPRTI
jgi:branched-chain amino acid transport system permease protein